MVLVSAFFGGNVKKNDVTTSFIDIIFFTFASRMMSLYGIHSSTGLLCPAGGNQTTCCASINVGFFFICILIIRLELTAANGRFS